MDAVTTWKNGATPDRFGCTYLWFQRHQARLNAPTRARGLFSRRANHEVISPTLTWLNGVSAGGDGYGTSFNFQYLTNNKCEVLSWIHIINTETLNENLHSWLCNNIRWSNVPIGIKRFYLDIFSLLTFSVETGRVVGSVDAWVVGSRVVAEGHFSFVSLWSSAVRRSVRAEKNGIIRIFWPIWPCLRG